MGHPSTPVHQMWKKSANSLYVLCAKNRTDGRRTKGRTDGRTAPYVPSKDGRIKSNSTRATAIYGTLHWYHPFPSQNPICLFGLVNQLIAGRSLMTAFSYQLDFCNVVQYTVIMLHTDYMLPTVTSIISGFCNNCFVLNWHMKRKL